MDNSLKLLTEDICPKCKHKAKPIVFGLIRNPSEDFVLGGCSIIPGFDPTYKCVPCDLEFGFGGRSYQTYFEFEVDYTNAATGETKTEERTFDLLWLPDDELLGLASQLIEARHELLHRGMSMDELELLTLRHNWRPFPFKPIYDVWFYWNAQTHKVEFATYFYSYGVRHIHGFYVPDSMKPVKAKTLSDFHNRLSAAQTKGLTAWNLRNPISQSTSTLVKDHELMNFMRAKEEVTVSAMQRFCNAVPDGQMWPSWYDPEQDIQ